MYDKVEIKIKSGDGGDGVVSFRREAFVPFGGPDGGDGGYGGNVVLVTDDSVTSLRMFRRGKLYQATKGGNGQGKKMHGKDAPDLVLKVPPGVMASEVTESGTFPLADLEQLDERVVIAKGGQGGKGNVHYASPTNQAPRIAQKGDPGTEKTVILELRLIADVGIIGYPNAGKSSLLTAASAARPEIAPYPFTTREPELGVVDIGTERFVLAEVPGIIKDAHLGKGLGHDFLRHAMRTKMLIHLVDGSSASPVDDMIQVNNELNLFDTTLAAKSQLVAVNKIDLPEVEARIPDIRQAFKEADVSVSFISAATGDGVAALMAQIFKKLQQLEEEAKSEEKAPTTVFRPAPRETISIIKENDIFVVSSPRLERIIVRGDMYNLEMHDIFQKQVASLGIKRALRRAGIKSGDKVRCGEFEWEWI